MKELAIDNTDGYHYDLKDKKTDKIYHLNIEFYGLEVEPDNIEKIYISEENLQEHQYLSFGPIEEKYGKTITSSDDLDLMILIAKDKTRYYLKRFYG